MFPIRITKARKRGVLNVIVIVAAATTLSACAEYLDRRDTLTRHAGEAQAFNKATQIVDPWPAVARRKRHHTDGERVRIGVDRYRKNKSLTPKTLSGDADIGGTSGNSGGGSAPEPG